jgi:exodeoxyribonuclease VII large subunit
MKSIETIRLTELQKVIRDKLCESFPGFFWVVAEIAEIKVNSSGHCYLELTDNENNGNRVTARARATIWGNRYNIISAIFSSVTGTPLQPGITILCKVTVEYHELYGLSLNITDIDPKYTVGEIALKRDAIIRRLVSEGIMEMNHSLEMPLYPRRIAVISSGNAAGYQDFIKHLASNVHGYVFETTLFDTVMQGALTESSVIAALDGIANSSGDFDAIAIIRGGGSQTDLSWFDNYNIAYLITQVPLPVLTGIGHDKDLTVSDMAAWKALKTPTAVADFFIARTLSAETEINDMTSRLTSASLELINLYNEKLARYRQSIIISSTTALKSRLESVTFLGDKLSRSTNTAIRFTKERISTFEKELTHLNPLNVLKRGYTITTKEGIILKNPDSLNTGDIITTHFEKGQAESTVENIKR